MKNFFSSTRFYFLFLTIVYLIFYLLTSGYFYSNDNVEEVVFLSSLSSNIFLKESLTVTQFYEKLLNHRFFFLAFSYLPFKLGFGEWFFFIAYIFFTASTIYLLFNIWKEVFLEKSLPLIHHTLFLLSLSFLFFLFDKYIPGGNSLITNEFTPSTIANFFALLFLKKFLTSPTQLEHKKCEWNGLLYLGISTLFQPLVGALLFVICLPYFTNKKLIKNILTYFLSGGWFFLLLLYHSQNLSNQEIWILTNLRGAHHYFIAFFDKKALFIFSIIFAIAILKLKFLIKKFRIFYLMSFISLLLYVAITTFAPQLPLVFAQMWKIVPFLYVFILADIASIHLKILINRFALTLIFCLAIIFLNYKLASNVDFYFPFYKSNKDIIGVARFLQAKTYKNETIIAPPSLYMLEGLAQRKLFFNYKAIPYLHPIIFKWHSRLLLTTKYNENNICCGIATLPILDSLYYVHFPKNIQIFKSFNINYAVIPKNLKNALINNIVYENNKWLIVKI